MSMMDAPKRAAGLIAKLSIQQPFRASIFFLVRKKKSSRLGLGSSGLGSALPQV
jgi:hypothetical protein